METFDYEEVNGRKIRVRPRETVSELDANGYFRRQPNHFTQPFGDGEGDLKAEGNGRYRLVWAKLCHWSNRASIVRELEGLEDQISVNMVEHAPHEKNLGWEYVYNEGCMDPILQDQFLSEAYYRADDNYRGRTTVPALIDTVTGKVVNNDYNWLTNYLEVQFRPWHKKGAPELYPEALRSDIDAMNLWLFDNINNAVYRSTFSRSNEGHFQAYRTFYAAMDRLEKRLETKRFLFGDYVTDADVRLYVTLARLDIRYTPQLGETRHPLYTYKNVWGYARELWAIPAFRNNTFFVDFAVPSLDAEGEDKRNFNYRFLQQIDFEKYWGEPADRARLSADPEHMFLIETDAGSAREDASPLTKEQQEAAERDREIYRQIHSIPSTKVLARGESCPAVKAADDIPAFQDDRAQAVFDIISEINELPDGPDIRCYDAVQLKEQRAVIKQQITNPVTVMLTTVKFDEFTAVAETFYAALDALNDQLKERRFLLGDFVSTADIDLFVTLARFDIWYSRYLGPVPHRIVDYPQLYAYAKDLYQIPAFAHHTDLKALVETRTYAPDDYRAWPNMFYDIVLPRVDLDAVWKSETDRAFLSEDPTHPIFLKDNRRFSLDPSWYDLSAESTEETSGGTSGGGCCC